MAPRWHLDNIDIETMMGVMTKSTSDVISAFDNAATEHAYQLAKRRAGRLDVAGQLAVVDAAIAARRRLDVRALRPGVGA